MTKTTQTWKIGDSRVLMQEMEHGSVDLIVTDPPYGYSFMGKDWDKAVPSVDLWKEAIRVLKPGAFAFIMSAPRQDVLSHNLVNLSDAGFETGFTSIYWTYASGFPKAGNISKLIDKRLGVEKRDRKSVEELNIRNPKSINSGHGIDGGDRPWMQKALKDGYYDVQINEPQSPQAKALDGSYAGFNPKPAVEVVMVVMKPLSEKTYADQALANGKGITWLNDGRIPFDPNNEPNMRLNAKNHTTTKTTGIECFNKIGDDDRPISVSGSELLQDLGHHNSQGRFPANLLVSDDVLNGDDNKSFSRYFDLDEWFDTKFVPKEAKKAFPFLVTPKASKREKKGSKHPTIKPVKLFTYLMTIGSREGDLVLDPFVGSGTALEAGRITNRYVRGFELDPQWEKHYADRAMKNTPSLDSF